jgi:hypothetical protein
MGGMDPMGGGPDPNDPMGGFGDTTSSDDSGGMGSFMGWGWMFEVYRSLHLRAVGPQAEGRVADKIDLFS